MARKAAQKNLRPGGDLQQAPPKDKVTICLDVQQANRLRAYAGFRREDLSEVVARALAAEMKGFQVHQRSPSEVAEPATPTPSAAPAGPPGHGLAVLRTG